MKYLFFDIDGTLLSHEKGILESTVQALEQAKAQGHKLFINTGRSLAEVGDSFDRFDFDGFVCAAGSHIIIEGEEVFNQTIDHLDILDIIDVLEELNISFGLEGIEHTYFSSRVYKGYHSKIKQSKENYADKEINGFEPYHYMIQPKYVRPVEDYIENPTMINKMLIYPGDVEGSMKLKKRLSDNYHLIIYDTFAELINKGIDKATGIDVVIDYYGANLQDTLALGDSLNDLEMIAHAGIGIAMGNAAQEVKQVADLIAPHLHEDGLYKALQELEII